MNASYQQKGLSKKFKSISKLFKRRVGSVDAFSTTHNMAFTIMLLVLYTSLITTDPVLRMSPAKERERSMMIAAVPDTKENAVAWEGLRSQ